jgi:tetratricopeptide (TPR) repeat protein
MASKKETKQAQAQATPKSNVANNKQAASKDWSSRAWLMGLLLVLAITFVAFIPALNNEFNNWDDDRYVTDNTLLTDLSGKAIVDIFTTPVNAVYCPLVVLSFAVEKQLFGLNPLPFHINNVLLHLMCVALVFWLMRLLKLRLEAAFLVALLFGIHTMRVESVTWVTERKDVLFGVFYLASMVLYVLSQERPQKRTTYLIASILLFIPALFSKIQAVALPLSLLCIDYLRGNVSNFKSLITESLKKAPYFALSLAVGLLGIYFLKEAKLIDVSNTFPAYYRPFFGAYTLIVYLAKFILPLPQFLAACYPYPAELSTLHYLSPILLIPIVVGIYLSTKYTRAVLFGFMFFFVNVVFVIQIVGAGQAYLADRFTYIPYLGLFMIWGYGLQYLFDEKRASTGIAMAGFGIYSLLLFAFTYQRNDVWQNSEVLWTDVISKYANVDVAFNNRGNYYKEKGEIQKALADFGEVLRIKPNNHDVFTNRGNLYFNANEIDKALADYEKVIEINPSDKESLGKAYNNRGSCKFRKNEVEAAFADYNKALELYPKYPDAYLNRAVYFAVTNQHEKAASDFTEYLSSKKENPQGYNWRGISYNKIGKYTEALQDFNTAIEMKPNNGEYYYNRSVSYNGLGNAAQAQADAQKATELGYQAPK